ncbi:MAG: head-tail adaptor protein [Candidatus Limiplasma sp.]|nr:head-tail adaptor protein [Candidatus Limiplasma sp.]
MSFGKMNTLVDIVQTAPVKDSEGFVVSGDTILATIRAYREEKHGNESWANRAAFSSASALFRFRKHSSFMVTTDMVLVCDTGRYRILSVEDVRERGLYIEVLAEKLEPTVR